MQLTVELGPDLEGFVREQVEPGCYRSADERVEAGLRLLEDALQVCEWHEQRIGDALQEGRDTYQDLPIEEARLRNRARYRILGAQPPAGSTPDEGG